MTESVDEIEKTLAVVKQKSQGKKVTIISPQMKSKVNKGRGVNTNSNHRKNNLEDNVICPSAIKSRMGIVIEESPSVDMVYDKAVKEKNRESSSSEGEMMEVDTSDEMLNIDMNEIIITNGSIAG